MANFEEAIPVILEHEGGLVDNPADPGGLTKYGISKASYPNVDIANLTPEQAAEIYKQDWWNKYSYDRIVDQGVANKTFDLAVNMGASQAHKILQQACGDAGNPTTVDGELGPNTLAAVNASDPTTLVDYMRMHARDFYLNLVKRRPSSAVFLNGWLARANS